MRDSVVEQFVSTPPQSALCFMLTELTQQTAKGLENIYKETVWGKLIKTHVIFSCHTQYDSEEECSLKCQMTADDELTVDLWI